jgi:ribonuclease HII
MPTLRHEHALRRAGFARVAGIDEAGRGAWAGPVVAAAVILPLDARTARLLCGVNDSKQLSPAQRAECRARIEQVAVAYGVGSASKDEIDALGIVPATRLAMTRAVQQLPVQPDALLIDAVTLPELAIHQRAFNYADSISLSVAAASILAKTTRDALMCELDQVVPGYDFYLHKGYGTRAHQDALRRLGVSSAHRRTYAPIRALLEQSAKTDTELNATPGDASGGELIDAPPAPGQGA